MMMELSLKRILIILIINQNLYTKKDLFTDLKKNIKKNNLQINYSFFLMCFFMCMHKPMLPHGDLDHMGEAINLVNNFKVEKVIFNCGPIMI